MLSKRQLDDYAANEIAIYQIQTAKAFLTNANTVLHNTKIREALNLLDDAELAARGLAQK